MTEKNKTTAGLLALFLGGYGAHHFYLGKTNRGILYLLLYLFTGIGVLVIPIIGLVEGIKYFTMSDTEFADYVSGTTTTSSGSQNQTVSGGAKSNGVSDIERYKLLKQYKGLLDCGAINQEEFEKIKSEILE